MLPPSGPGRRGDLSKSRSTPATDGHSGRHRLGCLARRVALAVARHPAIELSRDAQPRSPRSAMSAPAPPLARSSPTRQVPRPGRRSWQDPRTRQPVRRPCAEYRIRRSDGTVLRAPERPRRVVAAPPPQRDCSCRQDSTPEFRRSASHRRSRLILGHGPCLVKGPARPRRRCPRKNRAVVQTSGHNARSPRCVKSAMNNTNRKILWIDLHREGGASRNREDKIAPAPVRRNELPPD